MAVERRERFEALARDVAPAVLRYAVRRTDPTTAEDVLAETLLVLWRRLDDVPDGGELPWCYTVARNHLANADRSVRRQRRLVSRIARLEHPSQSSTPELPDPELHAALARLTPQEQELLRLSVWEDLAPAQIAEVLAITPNAVSIRLHRARHRLAELLEVGKPGGSPGHEAVREGGDR